MGESSAPRRSRSRASVYVGRLEERHESALAAFFRASWDPNATRESVGAWRAAEARGNPAEPGHEPPKWVFTRDGDILGYLGTIPDQFLAGDNAFSAYWLKGFWVGPEFRAGPVGFEILKAAVADLGATAALAVAPDARRLFEAHGIEERGVLFNRLRPLRPSRILSRIDRRELARGPAPVRMGVAALQATRTTVLVGAAIKAGVAATVALRGRPAAGFRVTKGWDSLPNEALDGLWVEFRRTIGGAAVRDADFLGWRYGDSERYRPVGIWKGERLRGWAVIRIPSRATSDRLRGVSVASLSDLLFPLDEPRVGCGVVAAAESEAEQLEADAVLCSGSHPVLEAVLSRRGFLPLRGNVRFLARDGADRVFHGRFESWWLTRGDGQADGAF